MPDALPPPSEIGANATGSRAGGQLAVRTASGLLLAAFALAVACVGGWPFVAFWGGAAVLVFWEWTRLVAGSHSRVFLLAGGLSVALAAGLAGAMGNSAAGVHPVQLVLALVVLTLGMLAAAALAHRNNPITAALGVLYAGALALGPIVLRSDVDAGLLAVVFLFAVVWVTDIVAYLVGRAVGGPKLAPAISPNKTWSGAISGTAAAVVVAAALGLAAGLAGVSTIAMLAAMLSVIGQIGDLFESALKRRFGAKDSSHLIPGHGGLMDRLDAFVAAAVVAAAIGVGRGGLDAPARGLLSW
jgi:phosphatidate cytidylyltransferase